MNEQKSITENTDSIVVSKSKLKVLIAKQKYNVVRTAIEELFFDLGFDLSKLKSSQEEKDVQFVLDQINLLMEILRQSTIKMEHLQDMMLKAIEYARKENDE